MTYKEIQCNFKIVSRYLRRTSLVYQGDPLSAADKNQFSFCIGLWYYHTFDVPGLQLSNIHRQMCCLFSQPIFDVYEFGKALDELLCLLRLIADDRVHLGPRAFKERVGHVARNIISLVPDNLRDFLDCPTPSSFFPLNQFLSFPRKISLRDIQDNARLERDYEDCEERIRQAPLSCVNEIRSTISNWMLTPDYTRFIPKHGPGHTAFLQGRDTDDKYDNLSTDFRLEYFFRHHSLQMMDFLPSDIEWKGSLVRTSETIFVPKTLKGRRVISAEPAILQYFQQGLLNVMMDSIKRSTLSRHINLEDQSLSRNMAKLASVFGEFATVDFSAASDSISWKLIKSTFPKWLVQDLYCFKTDNTILPSGKQITGLVKSSPMGSANCFPVECILFAAVAETACRLSHCSSIYRVYGDDVILPTRAVDKFYELSADLGLVVNQLKSYTNEGLTSFREACGIEAMNGIDVTPSVLSRQFYLPEKITSNDVSIFEAVSGCYNNLKSGGFHAAARCVLELLFDLLRSNNEGFLSPSNLRFSEDGTNGLISWNYSQMNWNLKKRFNRRLYLIEGKFLLSCPVKLQRRSDERLYFEWLLRAYREDLGSNYNDRVYKTTLAYRLLRDLEPASKHRLAYKIRCKWGILSMKG